MSAELGRLAWPEVPEGTVLLVPTGSCEQHGPHLPLDTDTLLAVAVAEEAARALGADRALVAPAVAVGASGEHQSFPGTLSIGTEALVQVVIELARSALPPDGADLPAPFEAVVVVNAHGGNTEALARAERLLTGEGRDVTVWHARVPGGDAHAGRTETSLMLHLHPERVRVHRAERGVRSGLAQIAGALRRRGLKEVTPNGILGDASAATEEEGHDVFEFLVGDLVKAVARLEN